MNWQDYSIKEKTDIELLDDFRLIAEEYSKVKSGKESELLSEENIISIAGNIIEPILKNRTVTFELDEMKKSSKELLMEVLFAKINQAIIAPAPLAESIWLKKQEVIQTDCFDFRILKSDKIAYGFIRLKEDGNIREFLPFSKPFLANSEKGYVSKMPLDWDLNKLDYMQIQRLHSDCHDRARWYSINTEAPPEKYMVNEHSYIIKEMKARNIKHEIVVELDRMSNDSGSINKNVFLSELMKKWNSGYEFEMPLFYLSGKCCLSGLGNEIMINVNWSELDSKIIDKVINDFKNRLPEKYRNKIKYEFDKRNGEGENWFVPIAKMKVELIPVDKREIIKAQKGSFRMQRLKNGN